MKKYTYYVTVSADNKEQADKVINHRINHDEDYGFAYRLNLLDAVPFDADGLVLQVDLRDYGKVN